MTGSIKEKGSVNAFIDAVEGGFIYGWAAYNNSDESVKINVVANERVIGQGEASIYRADLVSAGIHQGMHGFKIAINHDSTKDLSISLIDAITTHAISHNKVLIKKSDIQISGVITDVQNGYIITHIKCNQHLAQQKLNLMCAGEKIAVKEVDFSGELEEFRIALPYELMDGNQKLITLTLEGKTEPLNTQLVTIDPIQTPWQYLSESYDQPGFMSLPKQANYRYEALEYQLEAIVSGESQHTLENITNIHKLLIQGHEGRKRYPSFSLPKSEKPRVSIIVPAYNKFELTYHCIASIALAYNKTSFEVILADDCSDDETKKAEHIIENLVISRNPENLRFLRSCNKASDLANGEYIVFLNNDTEVTSFWLDELVAKMDEDSTVGMTGSKLLNTNGSLQEAGGIVWGDGKPWNVGRNANPVTPEYNYARQVDYLTGAAMCIRTTLWKSVEKFSEELVPCYYEDTDLAFKVREAGYKTLYVPHSVVVHFEGKSHGTDVTKGLKKYQVINEKTFGKKWFKSFKNNGVPSMANMMVEKDRNIDKRILVIDYATPMPNKDAGSYAAVQEMKLMQSLGFKVTFVPDNLAHFGKYTTELQRMGIEVLYAPFYVSVNDVLQKRLAEMDAVYITRYAVAEKYIDQIRTMSKAKVLFNNADLHFLRELRYALKNSNDKNLMTQALTTREKELLVCNKVDAILCYNTTEHAVIASHILQDDKMHITPWVLEEKNPGPARELRQGISFLGGYNHTPNVEAVDYLCSEIMPLLYKKRPDICLHVYGSNMPERFKDYEAKNIKIIGFAESLDDVYNSHRVFVAPLLSGAGIKGKVLEAMAYGTPCVLTEVAAEGTGLTQGVSTYIAKKPAEWVKSIISLYDDQKVWDRFSENELILVKEKYSFENGRSVLGDIFSDVGLYTSFK